jgi:hypothetical protein
LASSTNGYGSIERAPITCSKIKIVRALIDFQIISVQLAEK